MKGSILLRRTTVDKRCILLALLRRRRWKGVDGKKC
jgi:hypothetical protein